MVYQMKDFVNHLKTSAYKMIRVPNLRSNDAIYFFAKSSKKRQGQSVRRKRLMIRSADNMSRQVNISINEMNDERQQASELFNYFQDKGIVPFSKAASNRRIDIKKILERKISIGTDKMMDLKLLLKDSIGIDKISGDVLMIPSIGTGIILIGDCPLWLVKFAEQLVSQTGIGELKSDMISEIYIKAEHEKLYMEIIDNDDVTLTLIDDDNLNDSNQKKGPNRTTPCNITIVIELNNMALTGASVTDHPVILSLNTTVERNPYDTWSKEIIYTGKDMSLMICGMGEKSNDPVRSKTITYQHKSKIEPTFQKIIENTFTKHICITAPSDVWTFENPRDEALEQARLKIACVGKIFIAPCSYSKSTCDDLGNVMDNDDDDNDTFFVSDSTVMNICVVLDVAVLSEPIATLLSTSSSNSDLGNKECDKGKYVCICEVLAVRSISAISSTVVNELRVKAVLYVEQYESNGGLDNNDSSDNTRLLQYTMRDMNDFFLKVTVNDTMLNVKTTGNMEDSVKNTKAKGKKIDK